MTDAGRLRRSTVTLGPDETRAFVAAEWADALVLVARGGLEIECCSGRRAGFAAGAVLTLDGLPVRRLHNPGSTPVVLYVVRRRQRRSDDSLISRASHR